MQRHNTIEPVLHDALACALPGKFHITLVAEHRHTVSTTPCSRSTKIIEGSGRVARRVHPQHQRAAGVVGTDGTQVETALRIHRHGDRSTAGERRTHFIGRIRHRRKQHRVTVRAAQLHVLRGRGDELFRANTGRHLGEGHIDRESSLHPLSSGTAQRFAADTRWIPAFGVRRRQCSDNGSRRRIARCADREVNDAALVLRGNFGERV